MRLKVFLAILTCLALFSSAQVATAAPVVTKTQAKKATLGLQKLVNTQLSALKEIDIKHAQDIQSIQNSLKQDLDEINKKYAIDTKNFNTQINNALDKIDTLSKFIVQVDNLSRCNGLCAKGTVLTLPFKGNDEAAQRSIDQNVAGGAMAPQDKASYDLARKSYQVLMEQQPVVQGKFQQDINDRNSKARIEISSLNYDYEIAVEASKQKLQTSKSALKASKRALMGSSNFESNFRVALEFEYNLQMIQMVADSPFSSITSVLSARAVLSAADDYEVGYSIDQKYSDSKARAFNKRFGSAFTSDAEFKSTLIEALKFYRAANA